MGTVSKQIADEVIAGKYPEDSIVKIVRYTNAWGGESYGCISRGEPLGKYCATEFVINPTVYWEAPSTSPSKGS